MGQRVVFLDRDGVINRDSPGYIKSLEEFELLPGSLDALRRLTESGFDLIVVTNQSAIGRGIMALQALEEIHRHLRAEAAAAGARIRDIFFCPHGPGDGCPCRKPRPGMLLEARRRYGIDFAAAVMIGDSATDIECAVNAGVGTTVLVETGNGRRAGGELAERGMLPDAVVPDLGQASEWIIRNRPTD